MVRGSLPGPGYRWRCCRRRPVRRQHAVRQTAARRRRRARGCWRACSISARASVSASSSFGAQGAGDRADGGAAAPRRSAVAGAGRAERRRDRPGFADVRPGGDPGLVGEPALNLEGLATMAIAWLSFRRECRSPAACWARRRSSPARFCCRGRAGPAGFGWGALAIAGACLAWGIDNNLTRRLSAADPVQIAMIKGLAAGAVNLVLALAAGARLPPAGGDRRRGAGRLFRLRRQPRPVRARACAISARRAPAPISRPPRSSARCSRSPCSASR